MPPSKPGLLITFEGGEGSGKTTLIESIKNALETHGHSIVKTREPGGTPLGEKIRDILLSKQDHVQMGGKAESLLFLASRAEQIEEIIIPSLAQGKIVLCDRYNDSTVVYQGIARGLGFETIQNLCNAACGDVVPDITFFLDVDPKIGLERTAGLGAMDRIEQEDFSFHQKVRSGYHKLAAQEERIHIIDASNPREAVFEEALTLIEKKLKR